MTYDLAKAIAAEEIKLERKQRRLKRTGRKNAFDVYDFMKTVCTSDTVEGQLVCTYASTWSDEKVAEHFGVSPHSVKSIRQEKFGTLRMPTQPRYGAGMLTRMMELELRVKQLEAQIAVLLPLKDLL